MGNAYTQGLSPAARTALEEMFKDSYLNPSRAPINPAGWNVPGGDRVARDINTALGIVNFDLETPAKLTQAFTTVLEPMTPHVPGHGGLATNWRTITGVNTTNNEGGVPEGTRAVRQTNTGQQVYAAYSTIGDEDDVTEEAWEAGLGLEDLRARMGVDLLYASKVMLERMLTSGNGPAATGGQGTGLGGNALGTPNAPTLATSTAGGTIASGTTVYVGVVCLTRAGQLLSTIAGGVPRNLTVISPVAETYHYNGGSSQGSSTANIATAGGGAANSVSAVLGTIPLGTVAFAWFWGDITNQYLGAITTINSVVITTAIPTTPAAPATGYASNLSVLVADGKGDCSQNAYAFTGMIPLAQQFGTLTTQATGTPGTGTTLTSNGAAGIVEIDHILRTQFDATQTTPEFMLVSSQEVDTINTLAIENSGAPLFRFNGDASGGNPNMTANPGAIGNYFNKWTLGDSNPMIKVFLSPHVPKGTILMVTSRVPGAFYPDNNLGMLWELHDRRPWYQQEWPPRTRAYECGVYTSLTLAHYYPQTLSVIQNIAPIAGH